MDKYLISVAIAAKEPPPALLELCLASFSALTHAPRIQVVLVESGESAQIDAARFARFANVKRVQVPPEGVYAAYNAAIDAAEGTYILFFGIDDIALPGMDKVIAILGASPEAYHLFAATCYMQSAGVHSPSTRRTSLVFANWCHQGIFYLRTHLLQNRYDIRYRMQADHKLNIDIVSNPALRFGISKEMVAYFSAGGVSSVKPDLVFRKDFSAIVAAAYGKPWGWLVRAKQILIDLLAGPPEKRFMSRKKH